MSRLGLGTVQFGMDYGISNREGRPSEAEVAAILARAVEGKIGYLDTATGYADAEMLIGRHLPRGSGLRIVTKLTAVKEEVIDKRHGDSAVAALAGSLERLRSPQVYGVLLHSAGDLAKPGWQYLVDALREARMRGWTSRIGASIYDADDLALVQSRFAPDLVQLPCNALDARLVASGWLARLKAAGVEVHARSLFLQGLLLMEPRTLPAFFSPLRDTLTSMHAHWAAQKLTPLAGCLAAVLNNPCVDAAIVGVNRVQELIAIEAAVAELAEHAAEAGLFAAVDPLYLDPRRWPAIRQ